MNFENKIDWPVLMISGGLLVLFVLTSLINANLVSDIVTYCFDFSAKYFGAFWQVLMLVTFFVAIGLAVSSVGNIRLGNLSSPEMSTFRWIAIIMCTLLAGGGVFWAAAEPIYHFMSAPPSFDGINSATKSAVIPALSQSFIHWGFLAWAILGTLSCVVLMYGHYNKGMPLKPRTLLYPIFGEKIMKNSLLGTLVDSFSVIAVAAGTIGPIGFLGLQAAYGLDSLFGIPNIYQTQLLIVFGLVTVAAISAASGIDKGIQILSRFNIILTFILVIAMVFLGPGRFIFDSFLSTTAVYIQDFLKMGLYRGDKSWLSSWTVFFWGWFIGYGPMMAIFISRISRGRTLRELFIAVAVIAPLVTNFWFTVIGGSGIFYEMQTPGAISNALNSAGMPAAMLAITQQLPMGFFMATAFLFVTVSFVATTCDSMAYTISMAITGSDNPKGSLRVFWALVMGFVAAILLRIGEGSVASLQSFIVVTAVPVSLILLPMVWLAPKVAKIMAKEQGRKIEYKDELLEKRAS
ncbi:MAG: BCCT family transporter [Firmicutes bacterium]|nr:BCCT family transporter [Bacillota bacterium]